MPDLIGRNRAGVGRAAKRFGDDQQIAIAEAEAERRHAGRGVGRRSAQIEAGDRVGEQQVAGLFGDDKLAAVGRKLNLGRAGSGAHAAIAERPGGAGYMRQRPVGPYTEGGQVTAAAGVQHDQPAAVISQADGQVAVGGDLVGKDRGTRVKAERRDLVAAGIDGEEVLPVLADDQSALGTQAAAGTGSPGGERAGGVQSTVDRAVEDKNSVAGSGVAHDIDGVGRGRLRGGASGKGGQQQHDQSGYQPASLAEQA